MLLQEHQYIYLKKARLVWMQLKLHFPGIVNVPHANKTGDNR